MATSVSAPLSTLPLRLPQAARRWLPLIAILMLALFARTKYIADSAYPSDLRHFVSWMSLIEQHGVFHFYEPQFRTGTWDRTYPQLSTLGFGALIDIYGSVPNPRTSLGRPNFVVLLKVLPVAAELALIAVVYLWMVEDHPLLGVVIAGALALYPGLIATSAWWGQIDAPFTLFVILALICLNRDRPILAWIMFAIAVLLKQPALVLGPLLLVVTLRRSGWRTTALCLALSGGLCALVIAPFALGSGLVNALSPYLKAADAYPYLTNNAYNLWYIVGSLHRGGLPVVFQDPQFRDALPMISGLTFKYAGLLLFGGFVVTMMGVIWRQANQQREFVWAAALFFGFFMLPTQVHERYLYPAAILTLVAVAQDRRVWWVALGVAATFSYNILSVLDPARWRGIHFGSPQITLLIAFANLGLLLVLVYWTMVSRLSHATYCRVVNQPLELTEAAALNALQDTQ